MKKKLSKKLEDCMVFWFDGERKEWICDFTYFVDANGVFDVCEPQTEDWMACSDTARYGIISVPAFIGVRGKRAVARYICNRLGCR